MEHISADDVRSVYTYFVGDLHARLKVWTDLERERAEYVYLYETVFANSIGVNIYIYINVMCFRVISDASNSLNPYKHMRKCMRTSESMYTWIYVTHL